MQRPGPLRDIPLDHVILASNSSHNAPLKQRPNKRPLSPSEAAAHTSPAKRQMTSGECPSSVQKGGAALMWSSATDSLPAVRPQMLAPTTLLGNPARRLDFGPAMAHPTPSMAFPSPLADTFIPQPHPSSSMALADAMDIDDPPAPQDPRTGQSCVSDRQSAHYPGFDVFIDRRESETTTVTPSSSSRDVLVAPVSPPRRAKDADKENLAPRTRLARHVKSWSLSAHPAKLCAFPSEDAPAITDPLELLSLSLTPRVPRSAATDEIKSVNSWLARRPLADRVAFPAANGPWEVDLTEDVVRKREHVAGQEVDRMADENQGLY